MAKASQRSTQQRVKKGSSHKKKQPGRDVQVVVCPSGFPPISKKKRKEQQADETNKDNDKDLSFLKSKKGGRQHDKPNKELFLDWHDTAKEIRSYGAQAFLGQEKRNYEDDEYKRLTGRRKKKQAVPLPIVRGIQKAAIKKHARKLQEAKQAGIVLPANALQLSLGKNKNHRKKSQHRIHGPAPSIGFMKGGVFQMSNKKKR